MSKNIKRKGWIEFLDGQKIDIVEVCRLGNGSVFKLYTPVGIFYYRDVHNVLWHVDFNGITDLSGEPHVSVQSVKFHQFVLFDKQVKELYK